MAQSFREKGGPTDADRALAREASALGPEPISPWQVKRWREGGLLATVRRFPGHGGGSDPAGYLPGAAAHAACLAEVLARKFRLDEACLICFGRGFSPRQRTLRQSYAASYERVTTWLSRTAGGSTDTWDIADAAAAMVSRRSARIPQARAARERLRDAGQPLSMLRDVLTNVISLVLGAPGELRPETLVAFGMQGLLTPAGELGPLGSTEDLKIGWLSLKSLSGAVSAASLQDLELARDQFDDLLTIARVFASNLADTYGHRLDQLTGIRSDDLVLVLFGVPATLVMRQRVEPQVFDRNLEQLRAELPRQQAMRRMLDSLPTEFRPYTVLSAAQLAALPRPVHDQLQREIQAHFAAHPDDLAIFTPQEEEIEQPNTQ